MLCGYLPQAGSLLGSKVHLCSAVLTYLEVIVNSVKCPLTAVSNLPDPDGVGSLRTKGLSNKFVDIKEGRWPIGSEIQ